MTRCIHRQATEWGELQVWEDGDQRSLWFDDEILQSEINLTDPAVLPNPVNRAMLAHLLFGQQPKRVLLAGCGGGAIGRWFASRSPSTVGDAVDLSAEVLQVAKQFFDFPPADSQWTTHCSDVTDFLGAQNNRYDFILFDLEQQQHSPDWLTSDELLQVAFGALQDGGVATFNLIPRNSQHFQHQVRQLRQHFCQKVLCLPAADHHNLLAIAFRQPPELQGIEQTIQQASKRWGLPFKRYWQLLQQSNPKGSGIL